MAPHHGLVHPKKYDIRDSNVELIGTDIDHRVKHNSAATEPAWDGVGQKPGLRIWRIEQFQVIPWPPQKYGEFYDGDSYIVLDSKNLESVDGQADQGKLRHDIYFYLGSHTTQDEAGTAAYKTVELDEHLSGAAVQHREIQLAPSEEFLALFPKLKILSGGVRSGFRHVGEDGSKESVHTLLRVIKTAGGVIVHEVEPTWRSLDDGDVFIYDAGDKIWVWQGQQCSPMEKSKAAQVVHDMTLAKHIDVEVLSQAESRSRRVLEILGADDDTPREGLSCPRPLAARLSVSDASAGTKSEIPIANRRRQLFRLSDASGQMTFNLVKDGDAISAADLDGDDVFLLDDAGNTVWVWEGSRASRAERARWLSVAQAYLRRLQNGGGDDARGAHLIPLAKVVEGNESRAFMRAIEAR